MPSSPASANYTVNKRLRTPPFVFSSSYHHHHFRPSTHFAYPHPSLRSTWVFKHPGRTPPRLAFNPALQCVLDDAGTRPFYVHSFPVRAPSTGPLTSCRTGWLALPRHIPRNNTSSRGLSAVYTLVARSLCHRRSHSVACLLAVVPACRYHRSHCDSSFQY
ncbi:hypothetical protein EXIGLDRAFT_847150 [Exidia glandulosa HHB12029]|uniref:Uncharacterized protein n=1 Tax=Exidia glandulosa HHB12029 TaxID=1314781 RepID=A0A166N6L5_EXIGL|nr:hypothetical protein EXIGLDRAFT_847150 [Exidia glandulosa HHB12029]